MLEKLIVNLKKHGYYNEEYIYEKIEGSDVIILHKKYNTKHSINKYNLIKRGTKCSILNALDKDDFLKKKLSFVRGDLYDYKLVKFKGNHSKIDIICNKHGVFKQSVANHLSGQGCPKCANNYFNLSEYLSKVNYIHNNKYDYSKFQYINAITKSIIICPEHGEFECTPNNHKTHSSGCPKCSGRLSIKERLDRLKSIHNNRYEYIGFKYETVNDKIKIKCELHGIFEQTVHNHENAQGCPVCKTSIGEKTIKEYLDKNNLNYEEQYSFKDCVDKYPLKFDFYLPEHNICVEYDGIQHFEPVELFGGERAFKERKKRDNIKDIYCKENNIGLIRIPYYEKDNIDNFFNFIFYI
jgi:very-short-patch-repair endonuclease